MSTTEWNELVGLRTAVVSLLLRSIAGALVWAAATWGIIWLGTNLALPMLVLMIVAIVGGFMVGMIQSRGLIEQAGFASIIITVLACGFTAVAVVGASLVVEQLTTPLASHTRFLFCGAGFIVAGILIVRLTLLEG